VAAGGAEEGVGAAAEAVLQHECDDLALVALEGQGDEVIEGLDAAGVVEGVGGSGAGLAHPGGVGEAGLELADGGEVFVEFEAVLGAELDGEAVGVGEHVVEDALEGGAADGLGLGGGALVGAGEQLVEGGEGIDDGGEGGLGTGPRDALGIATRGPEVAGHGFAGAPLQGGEAGGGGEGRRRRRAP
jgi:hypothetical protein